MHNTKEVIDSNHVLHRIMSEGARPEYLYFNRKYYDSPAAFKAAVDMTDKPCVLV
jgi:hypothetical protein